MGFPGTRNGKIFTTTLPYVLLVTTLVAAFVGCAAVEEEKPAAQVPPVAEAQPKAPEPEKPVEPKEATLAEQPFKVEGLSVREGQGQTALYVTFSQPVDEYRHFPLTQPSRVVLDIFGEAKRLAQVETFRVDTNWIGTIRLSSGEGYLRLVLEIAAANVPPYAIEPENGGLKVTVGPVDPKATAKKELQLVRDGKRADVQTDVKTAEPKPSAPEAEGQAPTPQPETQLTEEEKYTGQRISLDFKDADIRNVFRLLAEVSGRNIIVTDDVQKRVTVRLVDVPWDQALDLLIETNGLGKEEVDNVIRISTAGQLKSEKDALAAAKQAEENLEPLQTAYLSVNYAKVTDLVDKIKPVLSKRPEASIVADERSNTLIVRDIRRGIVEANEIVSRLDTRTPQVLIESNLIETTPTFSRALGAELDFTFNVHNDPGRPIDFDSRHLAGAPFSGALTPAIPPPEIPLPTSGLRFGVFQDRVGSIRNLNAVLTAAENEGNINIISRPSVVTLNNVSSTIQSLRILRVTLPTSTNIASGSGAAAGAAVATEKIPVGIILTVTPQVSSDGFILMNINVKSSSLGTRSDGAAIPDELSREAISNVLVRDGETIVIGGIMKDTTQEAEEGVPYLKDIPVLGWLFKNIRWQKDFEELVVFITPRIVSAGSNDLPTAEELWRERLKQTQGG